LTKFIKIIFFDFVNPELKKNMVNLKMNPLYYEIVFALYDIYEYFVIY